MVISVVGAILAAFLAYSIARFGAPLAVRWHLVDEPHTASRKIHARAIPYVGWFALVGAVSLVLLGAYLYAPTFVPLLSNKQVIAVAVSVAILLMFGVLDDRYNLRARYQLMGPVIAAALVVWVGIRIHVVTNPFGGTFDVGGVAVALTFVWLMALMYSTKLLDGLDGLSTGLSALAAIMIFGLTQTPAFYEQRVGFVALVFAGACVGFLKMNFFPARAFLGEGGSLFLGFFIGILAIVSGSKLATTLLVMGLPVLDILRVSVVRMWRGKSPFAGDQLHLHHLLLRNGLSHRNAVLSYYVVCACFGVSALLLGSFGKLIMLAVLVLLGIGIPTILHMRAERKQL